MTLFFYALLESFACGLSRNSHSYWQTDQIKAKGEKTLAIGFGVSLSL